MTNKINRNVQEQINKITNPDFYIGKKGYLFYKEYREISKSDFCFVTGVEYHNKIDKATYELNKDLMIERDRKIGDEMILFSTDVGSWERVDLAFLDDILDDKGLFKINADGNQDEAFEKLNPSAISTIENTEILSKKELAITGDIVDFMWNSKEYFGRISFIDIEKDEIQIIIEAENTLAIFNKDDILRLHSEKIEIKSLTFLHQNDFTYCPTLNFAAPNKPLSSSIQLMHEKCDLIENKYYLKKEYEEDNEILELDEKLLKLIIVELKLNPQFFGKYGAHVMPYLTYYWFHHGLETINDSNMLGVEYSNLLIGKLSENKFYVVSKQCTDFTVLELIYNENPSFSKIISRRESAYFDLLRNANEMYVVSSEVVETILKFMTNYIKILLN